MEHIAVNKRGVRCRGNKTTSSAVLSLELLTLVMSDITYSSIKLAHHVRETAEKKCLERKKHVLHLILHHLKEEGYFNTAQNLMDEAHLSNNYQVCENIDLLIILQDFESYYYARFQKFPKICKKLQQEECISFNSLIRKKNQLKKIQGQENEAQSLEKDTRQHANNSNASIISPNCNTQKVLKGMDGMPQLDLQVISLNPSGTTQSRLGSGEDVTVERIIKPFANYSSEWKDFAEVISKEICVMDPNVRWDDVMGLDEAKRLLKEAVVYPIKYPELFSGILAPWKGLLLYGPPGTGKTLLAKAVATECKTTFFNISASSLVSKWRGDSEKLVKVMFELARHHAPSTIFLDELDALASHRDAEGEHESSRRLKAELLIQLDGLAHSEDRVFLLATSNLPWELDSAILRRLEKRILVDLPSAEAREAMLKHYLPPTILQQPALHSDLNYTLLAQEMEGYSGSDIKLVCKEAAMDAMREVFSVLESHLHDEHLPVLKLKTITTKDLQQALASTRPSAAHLANRFQKWKKEFGST